MPITLGFLFAIIALILAIVLGVIGQLALPIAGMFLLVSLAIMLMGTKLA